MDDIRRRGPIRVLGNNLEDILGGFDGASTNRVEEASHACANLGLGRPITLPTNEILAMAFLGAGGVGHEVSFRGDEERDLNGVWVVRSSSILGGGCDPASGSERFSLIRNYCLSLMELSLSSR